MSRLSTIKAVVLAFMALVSLTNLFGLSAAGISVIIGVIAYFVLMRLEKKTLSAYGLDFRAIGKTIRKPSLVFWMILPTIMNFLVLFLASLILPTYVDHVVSRSEGMLSVNILPTLIIQLLVLALGEEIAWRGVFQKQLNGFIAFVPALAVTSVLFSLGHLTSGALEIVAYDVLFIFVNSLIYGYLFKKTHNVWISTV